MYCLKLSELSWEYEAAMRIMDNTPLLPPPEVVEIGMRVINARKALFEHRKSCVFCNEIIADISSAAIPYSSNFL